MSGLVFWSSLILAFYAYLGYPLLLGLISIFKDKPVKKLDVTPTVPSIITAYNEEKAIQEKIENTLMQDYPRFGTILQSFPKETRIVAVYLDNRSVGGGLD